MNPESIKRGSRTICLNAKSLVWIFFTAFGRRTFNSLRTNIKKKIHKNASCYVTTAAQSKEKHSTQRGTR